MSCGSCGHEMPSFGACQDPGIVNSNTATLALIQSGHLCPEAAVGSQPLYACGCHMYKDSELR